MRTSIADTVFVHPVSDRVLFTPKIGIGKRVLLENGSFLNVQVLEVLESPSRVWETKENPTIV